MKYRNEAGVVEAFQWDGRDLRRLAEWASRVDFEGRKRRGEITPRDVSLPIDAVSLGGGAFRLEIRTFGGVMVVSPGDLVICGVRGEFYPCTPNTFEATYEPAE